VKLIVDLDDATPPYALNLILDLVSFGGPWVHSARLAADEDEVFHDGAG
jgi:hypothetical protein